MGTPRPWSLRPMPADFAEVAAEMSQQALQAHYNAGCEVIRRWQTEAGLDPRRFAKDRKEPPSDLAEQARKMNITGLHRHYGTSWQTAARWLRETGIRARQYDNRAPKPGHHRQGSYHKMTMAQKLAFGAKNHVRRDMSTEGRAADFLRKLAPVYRCTERGGVPEAACQTKLSHWRYGNVVLSPSELVDRARAKGWEPAL